MKFHLFLLPLLACTHLHADENLQNAGRAQFYFRSSSAFNAYTNSPSATTQLWINAHFWRLQSSSPYFDSRLGWMPNTWAYLDLYGIPSTSALVTQHPDWILRDDSGNRLYIPWGCGNGTCPSYAGDISNSGFRNWWISNAKSVLAKGYKGFWIDDVNMEFRISNGSGVTTTPYDQNTGATMTYDNWRRYIAEFTEQIRAALPTAEIVHNSIWFAAPTRYSDQYVIRQIKASDYQNCERGVSDAGLVGGSGTWSVRAFLDYVDAVHGYGKNVLFDEYTYNGDYGLAGYFLISNGGDAVGNQQASPDNWWSGYNVNLGAPLGPRYDWNNLIRRDFTTGLVLINPPKTSAITVALPSPLTRVDDGKSVTSVTLQPGQGILLTGPVAIPDYTLSLASATATVTAGSAAKYTGNIAAVNGYSGSVALSASGLPTGASASFSPSTINGSGSFTLTIATSTSTPAGTYSVTVAATSGTLRHTITANLQVGSVTVNLAAAFSRQSAYTDGSIFTSGGIDGHGFAYSKNLLGSTQMLGSVSYTFGAANSANGVVGSTVALPAGSFAALHFVGTSVNGKSPSQKFTVTYTDGTTTSISQSISDWATPEGYSGETAALTMPYRNVYSGTSDKRTFHLYSYSVSLNNTKTVRSFTLPSNQNVVVLAVTLTR